MGTLKALYEKRDERIWPLQSTGKLITWDRVGKASAIMMSTWFFFPQITPVLGVKYLLFFFCIWLLTVMLSSSMGYINRFYFIGIWALYAVLYNQVDIGSDVLTKRLFTSFILFIGVFIYHYYAQRKDYLFLGRLCKINLLFMMITSITTILALIQDPYVSRLLATTDIRSGLQAQGVGGYGFIYGCVLLIPCLFYYLLLERWKLIRRSMYILATFGIVIAVVIMASYTIAILLVSLGLVLCWAFSSRRRLIPLGCMLLIFIVIPKEGLADLAVRQVSTIQNEAVKTRLLGLVESDGNGLGANGDSRVLLYEASLATFVKHPISGIGPYYTESLNDVVGGHSEWLDLLARYGILGGLPFLLFFYFNYRFVQSHLHTYRPYQKMILVIYAVFFIFGTINTYLASPEIGFVLFLVIPSIPYLNLMDTNATESE